MSKQQYITPVRLRPVVGQSIGTTAFFRNRPLYDVLLRDMKAGKKKYYKLLFHACSIGAEVYSFVIQYLTSSYVDDFMIEVHATDLEQPFIDFARQGKYPVDVLSAMTPDERSMFKNNGEQAEIIQDIKQVIHFLDAESFLDFDTEENFDVVFMLNTLVYVPQSLQAAAIDKVSKYNNGYLLISAFHMNSIKQDLIRNNYLPVLDRQIEIHDSWTDRRVTEYSDSLEPGMYANWRLPAFSEIEDFEYKYCAIFRKEKDDVLQEERMV